MTWLPAYLRKDLSVHAGLIKSSVRLSRFLGANASPDQRVLLLTGTSFIGHISVGFFRKFQYDNSGLLSYDLN